MVEDNGVEIIFVPNNFNGFIFLWTFAGLDAEGCSHNGPFDTPAERYAKLKNVRLAVSHTTAFLSISQHKYLC